MSAQKWVHTSFFLSSYHSFLSLERDSSFLPWLLASCAFNIVRSSCVQKLCPLRFPGIPRNMGFFRAMGESSFSSISASLCYYLGPKAALHGPWFSLCDFLVEFFSACLSLLSLKGVNSSPWAWLGNKHHVLISSGVKHTNITSGFSCPMHINTCRSIFGYLHSHMYIKQPNCLLV